MVRNSEAHCETTINSPPGRNFMQDGQKFSSAFRDNDQLTRWTEFHARWSEIQQRIPRQRSTHKLDGISCKMVRNSVAHCETTINSPPGRNFMQDGQKFSSALRDNDQLTAWTEFHARWSEIQKRIARQRSTHRLDGISCKMVRNSVAHCETTINSPPGRNFMQDGQKFSSTLRDNDQLTSWTEFHARWSEIQQRIAR